MQNTEKIMPRERLMKYGENALSDVELLAIILGTGTKGKPVLELASDLLEENGGSLLHLCGASVNELSRLPGIGKAKAVGLCAVFALVKRLAEQSIDARAKISSPMEIADYMRRMLVQSMQEEFFVLHLDTQMCVMRVEHITKGLVDRSLIHPREVFRSAIREASTYIMLCHNHPSGMVRPSANDISITKRLCEAGAIIGIKVVDHIIVGPNKKGRENNYYSFVENGTMPKVQDV